MAQGGGQDQYPRRSAEVLIADDDPRWIEPLVGEKAVAGYEKLRPVLARKPLEQAENNYAEALLLHQLFGPILVETAG